MRIRFGSDSRVFPLLANLAREALKNGWPLRVIGGIALHAWIVHLSSKRRFLTQDIDFVLPSEELASRRSAESFATSLDAMLGSVGFDQPVMKGRLHRARFQHHDAPHHVDLVCGILPIGRMSEKPRYRIVRNRLYASQIPWLENIKDEWVSVHGECDGLSFEFEIPSLSGLTALKTLALDGKLALLQALEEGSGRDREERQFVKHAEDLIRLRGMLESSGSIPDLRDLVHRFPELPDTARRLRMTLQLSPRLFSSDQARGFMDTERQRLLGALLL